MLLGPDGEAKLVDGWKQKYKTDMFTSSQNQVNVLRAMKLRKIVGVTPFGADLNKSYAKYFEDCGVGVVAMEGMDIAFGSIPDVPSEVMYSFIKKKFLAHTGADAIYILGSGWDTLGIVAALEQDLGVPVIQPIAARIWEIQRRLHVRQPIKGYGGLLETSRHSCAAVPGAVMGPDNFRRVFVEDNGPRRALGQQQSPCRNRQVGPLD